MVQNASSKATRFPLYVGYIRLVIVNQVIYADNFDYY